MTRRRKRILTVAAGLTLATACGVHACKPRVSDPQRAALAERIRHPNATPFVPFAEFQDKDFYLCCTMRFNDDHDASDANYSYPNVRGYTFRAGTKVHVVSVRWNDITIRPEGESERFNIDFRFGTQKLNGRQFFHYVLVDADPTTALAQAPKEIVDAVNEGRLLVGMTKEQAVMARGYPPFHQTTGIESDQWTYYFNRASVDHVTFVDGKITAIERGPAP